MDTMELGYLAAALVVGFIFAWLICRSRAGRKADELQSNASTLQRSLTQRENDLTDSKAKLTAIQAQLDAERDSLSALQTAADQSDADLAAAAASGQDLQARLDAALESNATLEGQKADLSGQIEALNQELADQQIVVTETSDLLETTRISYSDLSAAHAAKVAEAEDLAAQVDSVTKSLLAAEAEVGELASQLASATAVALNVVRPLRNEVMPSRSSTNDLVITMTIDEEIAKRDMLLAKAQAENEHLRRSLSTMTNVGAELAKDLRYSAKSHRSSLERLVRSLDEDVAAGLQERTVDVEAIALPADPSVVEKAEQETIRLQSELAAAQSDSEEMRQLASRYEHDLGELRNSLAAAETRLELAQQDRDDSEATLSERDAKLEELQQELSALRSELDDLTVQDTQAVVALSERDIEIDELQNQLGAVEMELDSARTEQSALTAALADQDAALAELGAQLADKESALATLSAALEKRDATLTDLSAALDDKQAGLADLQSEFERVSAEEATVRAALVARELEVADLREQLIEATVDLDDAVETKRRVDVELQAQTAIVNELAVRSQDLAQALADRDSDVGSLNEKLEILQSELDLGLSRQSDFELQLAQPDVELQEAQEKLVSLQTEFDGLSTENAALLAQLQAKDGEVTDLRGQIDQLAAQVGGLDDAKAQLESDLEANKTALATAEAEIASVQTASDQELEEKANLITQLSADLAAVKFSLDQRVAELAQANEQLVQVQQESDMLQASLEDRTRQLQETSDDLQQRLDGLTQDRQALEQTLVQRTAEHADLLEQMSGLQEKLSVAEAHEAELQADLQSRVIMVAALETQFSDLEEKLNALQSERDQAAERLQLTESDLYDANSRLSNAAALFDVAPDGRAPEFPLSNFTSTKSSAASAAIVTGTRPVWVPMPQDLSDVKGVGSTYQQRLYEGGIGTFWELATMTDADFEECLNLSDLQRMRLDFTGIRSEAMRLATETGTLGYLWDGQMVDDFEPILGIGKTFEHRLYVAGIRTYADLAATSVEQLSEIIHASGPQTPHYASWIEQAAAFADAAGEQAASDIDVEDVALVDDAPAASDERPLAELIEGFEIEEPDAADEGDDAQSDIS